MAQCVEILSLAKVKNLWEMDEVSFCDLPGNREYAFGHLR